MNFIFYKLSSFNKVPQKSKLRRKPKFYKLRRKKKMTKEFSVPFWKSFFFFNFSRYQKRTHKQKKITISIQTRTHHLYKLFIQNYNLIYECFITTAVVLCTSLSLQIFFLIFWLIYENFKGKNYHVCQLIITRRIMFKLLLMLLWPLLLLYLW